MEGEREPTIPFPAKLVDLAMPSLSDSQWRVLCVIVRQTLGWTSPGGARKERDWLSHSQLRRRTGRSGGAVSSAVETLDRRGLILATDESGERLDSPRARRRARRVYYALDPSWGSRLRKPERTKETRYQNSSSSDTEVLKELLRRRWG